MKTSENIKNKFICETCGNIFISKNSNNGNRFCSRTCFYNRNDKKINVHCKYCGKKFIRINSVYKQAGNHYCSYKCHGLDRKINNPETAKNKIKTSYFLWRKFKKSYKLPMLKKFYCIRYAFKKGILTKKLYNEICIGDYYKIYSEGN